MSFYVVHLNAGVHQCRILPLESAGVGWSVFGRCLELPNLFDQQLLGNHIEHLTYDIGIRQSGRELTRLIEGHVAMAG
jgi:hypothetical protein